MKNHKYNAFTMFLKLNSANPKKIQLYKKQTC